MNRFKQFLVVSILFLFIGSLSSCSNTGNLIFLNLSGGGWDKIEVKVNGKKVDALLNGVVEISTYCNKGKNTLLVNGAWEETKYLNSVDFEIKVSRGSSFFDNNAKVLLKYKKTRNENKRENFEEQFIFKIKSPLNKKL